MVYGMNKKCKIKYQINEVEKLNLTNMKEL